MAMKHLNTVEFDVLVDEAPLAMVDFWASWPRAGGGVRQWVGGVVVMVGLSQTETPQNKGFAGCLLPPCAESLPAPTPWVWILALR